MSGACVFGASTRDCIAENRLNTKLDEPKNIGHEAYKGQTLCHCGSSTDHLIALRHSSNSLVFGRTCAWSGSLKVGRGRGSLLLWPLACFDDFSQAKASMGSAGCICHVFVNFAMATQPVLRWWLSERSTIPWPSPSSTETSTDQPVEPNDFPIVLVLH